MGYTYDWLFWIGGGVLGLSGLILLIWSLFADRSKGRKRCPKCWYEMTHSPGLTCSECGKTHKKEKKLLKTKRRWRWAIVAFIVVISSRIVWKIPALNENGWATTVPTTLLILFEPWLDHSSTQTNSQTQNTTTNVNTFFSSLYTPVTNTVFNSPFYMELIRRADNNELWNWQWKWLVKRTWNDAKPPFVINIIIRKKWPADTDLWATMYFKQDTVNYPWIEGCALKARIKTNLNNSEEIVKDMPGSVFGITNTSGFQLKFLDFAIGKISADLNEVRFDVTIERQTAHNNSVGWEYLWKDTFKFPITTVKTADDIIKKMPDSLPYLRESMSDSEIRLDGIYLNQRDQITPYATQSDYNKAVQNAASTSTPTTLALRFELICNGEIVASAKQLWNNYQLTGISNTSSFILSGLVGWDDCKTVFRTSHIKGKVWKLRIRSDPFMALRYILPGTISNQEDEQGEIQTGSYWDGEMEFLLQWDEFSLCFKVVK